MDYTFTRQPTNQPKRYFYFKPVSIKHKDSVKAILRPKLKIGAANDRYEQEADRVAHQVMTMPDPEISTVSSNSTGIKSTPAQHSRSIQRSCISCLQEHDKIQQKPRVDTPSATSTTTDGDSLSSLQRQGKPLSHSERNFFEPRFATDFSQVRIHNGTQADNIARTINARAFTLGNNVVFSHGEYTNSVTSKQLLAHELAHVVQQRSSANKKIQRKKYQGSDNYGTFSLDDSNSKFLYRQKWFYNFHSGIATPKRQKLMNTAASQVKKVWSNKYPLIPTSLTPAKICPCKKGASVEVDIVPTESRKKGRGVSVNVVPKVRANVNPVTGVMTLEKGDFSPATFSTGPQYTVAHEFGHTINLTDEYNLWSKIFVPSVERDKTSIMNSGNTVLPRHYQYFGDILSAAVLGCRYNPNGIRQLERENPVLRSSTLSGLTTYQDGVKIPGVNSNLSLGENYNLRVSNNRLFGLFYPHIGAIKLWNPDTEKKSDIGITTGVSLGQIAHPLTVNLNTGVVINPADPSKSLRIPLSIQVGLRTSKYEFGIHYTPVFNVLPRTGVTHLFGVGLRI